MIANANGAQYLCASADIDLSTNFRRATDIDLSTNSHADRYLLEDQAIRPDFCARMNDDSVRMRQQ
jgi:hypothetical protein